MRPHPSIITFRRLPARYAGVVTPFVLSLVMTFVVSAIATARSVGLTPDFLTLWMSAWGLSWLIAFPTLLMVLPIVRRITGLLVEPPLTD
jgi:VIT1/CCC1 family predicted Fe2+/Mn2+ transporter